ncbi:MAG: TAXI family TRAP transporter solute-binding subunit [Xanthomonadales bacterium]|nr:TAXI family TRAP transporter solute-binding subunit [Xanthomonadales bacterium]
MKRQLGLLFLALLCLGGCRQRAELTLGWVSVEPAAGMARTLEPILAHEFSLSGRAFADVVELQQALLNGEVDVAIMEQPHQPVAGLSALMPLFPNLLHVLVPAELAGARDLAELVKKRLVYGGPPGSSGYRLVMDLSNRGILPPLSQFQLLETPLGQSPEVYLIFGGLLSDDALSRLPGYRLYSLGEVSELGRGAWVEGVALRYLHLDPFVIPQGLYGELSQQPVLTLAVTSLLVARSGLAVETAYDVSRLTRQQLARLEAVYPLARDTMLQPIRDGQLNLALHPGARRYLERDAPSFLERYAELLALLVTLLIAVTSAAVALLRMRRQARKDRIDVYLAEVLRVRADLRNGSLPAPQAMSELSELQATVTRLVVDERIEADSSFVGFLSLSNQVLAEAGRAGQSTSTRSS